MTALHQRLGMKREHVGAIDLLQSSVLPDANVLFDRAFERAPEDPTEAQTLLSAALLSQAGQTPEGRLSGTLAMMARLVAKADPMKTLGPDGSELRDFLMPNGWRYTAQSWARLRYAWREGMRELLDVHPDDPVADALDEMTRMNAAEPEPVSVAIQEQFPPPKIALGITVFGLGLTLYGVYRTSVREKELEIQFRRSRK